MKKIDLLEYQPGDIARGFARAEGKWACLICGVEFEDGVVFDIGGWLYEAGRAAAEHVKAEHGSVFRSLLKSQEDYLGLTEHQAHVLGLMHAGHSDKEIAEQTTGGANTSAVRNLRFQMKEREKQARAYLALMEAFRLEREAAKAHEAADLLPAPAGATMTDERFAITTQERASVLKTYFQTGGTLKEFPVREKRKIIVLQEIATRFEAGRRYTEPEVNERIAYRDFATVRRYLIEYGFLERSQDCRQYWVKEKTDGTN